MIDSVDLFFKEIKMDCELLKKDGNFEKQNRGYIVYSIALRVIGLFGKVDSLVGLVSVVFNPPIAVGSVIWQIFKFVVYSEFVQVGRIIHRLLHAQKC